MTLTGFMSQAQMTRAAWTTWNMDTTGYASAVSGAGLTGDSKTITIPTNFGLTIQVEVAVRGTEIPAANSLSLWGSMDNTTWVRVPTVATGLATTVSAPGSGFGTACVSRSNPYAIGTYPTYTQPSLAGSILNAPLLVIAGDSVALGTTPAANTAVTLNYHIPNPSFTYYKFTYYATKAANTNATVFSYRAKYYLRKPY